MAAPALQMSLEAYFAWVTDQDEKHEYYDGEVFSMDGGSDRHALATVNATVALAGHSGRAAVRCTRVTCASN